MLHPSLYGLDLIAKVGLAGYTQPLALCSTPEHTKIVLAIHSIRVSRVAVTVAHNYRQRKVVTIKFKSSKPFLMGRGGGGVENRPKRAHTEKAESHFTRPAAHEQNTTTLTHLGIENESVDTSQD